MGLPSEKTAFQGAGISGARRIGPGVLLPVTPASCSCTSARCHLQCRDLPSLFATFASSRETSVLSITPHAKPRRPRRGVAGDYTELRALPRGFPRETGVLRQDPRDMVKWPTNRSRRVHPQGTDLERERGEPAGGGRQQDL